MLQSFYHQLIRKYHIAFGSLFKDLTLLRNEQLTNDGSEAQRFVVPIEYSARELWLSRLRQDPTLSRKDAIVLPRLAFEMVNMRYDAARKLNSMNQRLVGQYNSTDGSARKYFVGVPYLFSFNLYAITRSVEDANQIIEQIVPHFNPDYSLTLKLIPSVGILDRMRIVLDAGTPEWSDSYLEAGIETTREILLTFRFTVTATLYGPIAATPSDIIRRVIVDLYDSRYDQNLTGPLYILTDSLDRFELEDSSGRLIDEESESDLRKIARVARIDIVPNPIDAAPIKPVDTTTTITEFEDGKALNQITGIDSDIDVS